MLSPCLARAGRILGQRRDCPSSVKVCDSSGVSGRPAVSSESGCRLRLVPGFGAASRADIASCSRACARLLPVPAPCKRVFRYNPCETRRDGRVAEGGGLLNRCRVKSSTGGSNPPLSAIHFYVCLNPKINNTKHKTYIAISFVHLVRHDSQILLYWGHLSDQIGHVRPCVLRTLTASTRLDAVPREVRSA